MLTRRSILTGSVAALTSSLLEPVRALAETVKSVRITDIESFQIRVPSKQRDPLAVYDYGVSRVHTDAGVLGTSFVPCPNEILRTWVKPTLVGQDLFAIDRHIDRLQMMRGESGVQIWSGVEHAMWDAVRQIAGQPGKRTAEEPRDKLRVTGCNMPWRTPRPPGAPVVEPDESDIPYEVQAQYAVRLKKAGLTGMKVRAWRPHPMDDVDMVGVVRAAVGPDFHIMLDRTAVRPGWVWGPDSLGGFRGLEKHKAFWLEEPFDGHDIFGPARLAAEVEINITQEENSQRVPTSSSIPGQQDLRHYSTRYTHLWRHSSGEKDFSARGNVRRALHSTWHRVTGTGGVHPSRLRDEQLRVAGNHRRSEPSAGTMGSCQATGPDTGCLSYRERLHPPSGSTRTWARPQ